jgi:pSer/pThr/pTyr-binding forkhead associated (FHA) protein
MEMERNTEEVALLVAQSGPLNGQRWTLRKSALIGREAGCDIVIPDRQVSRHHARLRTTPEGVYIEDLGSKNGTFYNGQALKEIMLLQDGDTVQIALAQKFVYLSSDATVPLDEGTGIDMIGAEGSSLVIPGNERLRLEKRSRRVWIRPTKSAAGSEKNEEEIEILPPLSVSQFRLLEILCDNQGKVVSRQELVTAVWGEGQVFDVSEQALDALVRRLRDRIASIDPRHEYIVTVRGHGLRLENPQ